MDSDFIALVPALVPALVGALGGSFGGIFISDILKRRNERENLRKNITSKYLIQLQYALESLNDKFSIRELRGGSEIKRNDHYYIVSTLYAWGTVLSYDRLLLFEGVYAQLDDLYGSFGFELRGAFASLGRCLDEIRVLGPDRSSFLRFLRYERIALGDALIVRENGNLTISSYLDFKQRYETDSQFKLSLEPAREFVESLDLRSNAIHDLHKAVEDMLQMVYNKATNIITMPR